ncbi:MAG: type II toxin-antitoxin system VapC family toxin [Chitinophagia bacterium]|nr:type II toxin-antitoxin system VapC family toxin [Chitinophagia bacterium]
MGYYLIDTNTISDYLAGDLPPAGMLFMDKVIDDMPIISVITKIELLCWNCGIKMEQLVAEFINECTVININDDVIFHCASIRKQNKTKLPDAIIAATAKQYNYTLITNNEKDFIAIEGVITKNPLTI